MKTTKTILNFSTIYKALILVIVIICMTATIQGIKAGNSDPKFIGKENPNPNQGLTIEMTPYVFPNGFNVSCFGSKDGSINLSVSGGATPYKIFWSTKDTTEDISNLSAGYYHVIVMDADSNSVEDEITLTQPEQLGNIEVGSTVFSYPNGYNVSCIGCYNGSIDITVAGGSGNYTYTWRDGPTTQDRTGLGAEKYDVLVKDASVCSKGENVRLFFELREPPIINWSINGNAGTNPNNQFIGTLDNIALAFKTNNAERMRINANGNVGIGSNNPTEKLHVVGNGKITGGFNVSGNVGIGNTNPTEKLTVTGNGKVSGNFNVDGNVGIGTITPTEKLTVAGNGSFATNLNVGGNVGIGVVNPIEKLEILGNGKVSGNFNVDGNIGIGTISPTFKLEVAGNGKFTANLNVGGKIGIGTDSIPTDYLVAVGGKMLCTEINVQLVNDWVWPDYVFEANYDRMTLPELEHYINTHKHLPNVPSAEEIKSKGVNVGETNSMLLQKIEELTLYIIEQNKKIENLQKEVDIIKNK